jgi:NNP family nitrate/nitrite transporter-like MFS transporter
MNLTDGPGPASCHCPADNSGPRTGIACCLGFTAPAVFGIAMVNSPMGFVIARLIIGFTLSNFVACQFWCTSTFNAKVVATANSFGAGMVRL